MTTTTDRATLTTDNRVATLTLNRPDKRNALSLDLLEALNHHITQLAASPDNVNALVITGAGRSFCAGMDLKAVLGEPGAPLKLLSAIAELTTAIRALPIVTIAKINGAAVGGGCGLACACDITITHPDAKLGFPEIDLSVCPAVVAPWLAAKIGLGRARRVLLSGGTMSGHDAHTIGIADICVPAEQLDDETNTLTNRLANAGHHALAQTKSLLNTLDTDALTQLVHDGAQVSADVIAGEEAQHRLRQLFD